MSSHTYTPPFPKKIDRSSLYGQSSFSASIDDDMEKAYVVEPLFTLPSLAQARRRVVADCLARAHHVPLISSINPNMMSFTGVSPSMLWEARGRLSHEIQTCLHRLGVRLSHANILDSGSMAILSDVAERLVDHHSVSCRDDVTFFNINQKTVVPDHRVTQEKRKGIRYHIRFFVEAKKHSVVASLDEPCFLFGCVAILVHPLDKRYKKLVGKDVIIPLINKAIPLLAHDSVSMEWEGTMMLIPAHRREDYYLALEMGLPTDIYAIDQYGCFTTHAKEFAGKLMLSFRENIIQFLDDISNIDQKEYTTISHFVDSQTHDILLPILQKNIFVSLYADTLQTILMDESLVMRNCPDTLVETLAWRDSRRCISGRDTMQTQVPYTVDAQNMLHTLSFRATKPLLTCIVADAVMMGICPSLVQFDVLIEWLLVVHDAYPLINHILSYYETYYPEMYARDAGDKIHELFAGIAHDDEMLHIYSDDLLRRLETSDGIICTDQWYVVADLPQHHYSYDHEYVGMINIVTALSHLSTPRQLSYFFASDESYRLTHSMLLLSHMADRQRDILIPYVQTASLMQIAGSNDSMDESYMRQIDLYGGDVVRLSLLLTSSLMDEEQAPSYSLDMLHRFLTKRRNASRLITMTLRASDISVSKHSLTKTLALAADQMSDYDLWIVTNMQRIINDVVYYRDKYAVATSVHLCIQSLRYDLAEIALTILKHYPSPVTPLLCALMVYAWWELMQAYAPHSASSLLSCIATDDHPITLDEILALDYTKNYKCTLMMDVIRQWHLLLAQASPEATSLTLLLQANKDFADYVARHEELIMHCFPQASITYISESETIDETIAQSRIMNVVVALQTQHKEPEPVVSLSVLTGQHAYKKQLIQTLRNTIMRLRQSRTPANDQQIITLEAQITDLQKEIETLDYAIAKMKYYKN